MYWVVYNDVDGLIGSFVCNEFQFERNIYGCESHVLVMQNGNELQITVMLGAEVFYRHHFWLEEGWYDLRLMAAWEIFLVTAFVITLNVVIGGYQTFVLLFFVDEVASTQLNSA